MDEMPETDVFIIPIRLNDCEVPYRLESRHCVGVFPDYRQGLDRIVRALAAYFLAHSQMQGFRPEFGLWRVQTFFGG